MSSISSLVTAYIDIDVQLLGSIGLLDIQSDHGPNGLTVQWITERWMRIAGLVAELTHQCIDSDGGFDPIGDTIMALDSHRNDHTLTAFLKGVHMALKDCNIDHYLFQDSAVQLSFLLDWKQHRARWGQDRGSIPWFHAVRQSTASAALSLELNDFLQHWSFLRILHPRPQRLNNSTCTIDRLREQCDRDAFPPWTTEWSGNGGIGEHVSDPFNYG